MPTSTDLPLLCPVCSGQLVFSDANAGGSTAPGQHRLACTSGHSFDAARQGYFNLLVGKGTAFEADTAGMVEARFNFLGHAHYRRLAEAVAAAVVPCISEERAVVLDSGTGTGHYLRVLLDTAAAQGRPVSAVGLDISKFALRRAARLNPEAVNLVWDVWQPLPLANRSVDAVTVVFAPRNPPEFARVLRPTGRLVVVTPRDGHLAEIAAMTGMLAIEEGKDVRLAAAMGRHFDLEASSDVDIPLALTRPEAADLAFMGPAGHHLERREIVERLEDRAEPVRTEAKFRLLVFRPKNVAAA
ncbi:methyltransferase domain-containing protein [Pseudarthrobacter sp. NS4]|uniref:methyltransferase domain-containing protein n=1 Tax=Pseudarthrobacter sp. NS4 TaxID=2973976 RepID=UPI002161E178|nr:methyltransferase domain-containing protein [Pseudarthrobacter sp. NS4]